MALHEVQLKGYSVRPGNLSLGTFDSYGIEQLHVTADDSWDGLDILAVFHAPNGDAKKVVVVADGMLNVPPEATAKQAGNGRIVFVGLAENVQRITVDMGYNIKTHSDIEGDNPGVPTPDVVQQILENSNHAVSIATAAQVSAENARQAAEDAAKKAGEESGGAAYSAAAAKKSAEDAAASSNIAADKAEASASSANVANESAEASQAAQSSAENSAQSAAKSARAAADSAASIVGDKEQSAASANAARNFAEQAKKASDSAAASASASKEAATQAIESSTSAADSAANAEAAKTAAAESATAAAKSAADADSTANSINESMTQIAANKEAVSQLKEDLGDIESKFEIETEAFVNKCSIIRNNVPNNFIGNQITGIKQYFDFGKNAELTKIKMNIKASNDDTAVLEIASLDGNIIATAEKAVTTEYTDVVFDLENIVIKEPVSVFVYTKGTNLLSYGAYGTPYDNPLFSYTFPDGTKKILFKIGTVIKNPTTSNNKQCLVLFFDYTSKVIKNIFDSISQSIDATLSKSGKSADAKVVGDKLRKLNEDINFNGVHAIFVSTSGSDETGDGTEENPYATIFHANEVITDNSETNRYKIIVKQGTYTDLQEKYAGIDGTYYQGVTCKSYVTYESEDITRPDLCVLKWDGSVGYTKPVTDANCVNKCLFHIKDNSQGVYIKGFTFVSKNTRYCMHIETVGSTKVCDWHFENCVFEWGGRPDTTEDGTVATACIGTGYSMLEFGEFINCTIKCTNTNHANHMVFQSHDNPDNIFTSIKRGEHLRFENCYFSIADGSDYAHIDLRTTKTSPIIPSFAEFINCSGIKLYVPSETYKKSFVCTEQHTN